MGCVPGVTRTLVGYDGGIGIFPNYGTYAHLGFSETVWIEYDPKILSFNSLIDLFFASHDPTMHVTVGYRSIIFFNGTDQYAIANKTLERVKSLTPKNETVFTALKNSTDHIFWPAEDAHQHFQTKEGERCEDGSLPAPEACPGSLRSSSSPSSSSGSPVTESQLLRKQVAHASSGAAKRNSWRKRC